MVNSNFLPIWNFNTNCNGVISARNRWGEKTSGKHWIMTAVMHGKRQYSPYKADTSHTTHVRPSTPPISEAPQALYRQSLSYQEIPHPILFSYAYGRLVLIHPQSDEYEPDRMATSNRIQPPSPKMKRSGI